MTSPVPGLAYPDPRTWSKGDVITVPRLRGDMGNLASLMVSGRPMVVAWNTGDQSLVANTPSGLALEEGYLNNWNVQGFISAGVNASTWTVPWTGMYLMTANMFLDTTTSGPENVFVGVGFNVSSNGGSAVSRDGGNVPLIDVSNTPGGTMGADLYQLNSYTADTIQWYGYTNLPAGDNSTGQAWATAEWVALADEGLSDYPGPYGTVVASPPVPAAFPSGQGTYITNSGGIAAGATSVTVHDATGIVTGGTLGLDVINGQYNLPTAEAVNVTGITGTTVSIGATSFSHAQNAPVAVPVSAAFLNTYSTDLINFLAYPPFLRASQSSAQTIPSQTFPNATQITSLNGDFDNFAGLSSSTYTVPVSGTYFVYGQVYWAGSAAAVQLATGISVNGGTIDWGGVVRADTTAGATPFCTAYARTLRLTAGNTIEMFGSQNAGANMATLASTQQKSRLVMVFRSF